MNKKLTYLLLGLIFILASLPVLRPGIFKMHDFTHGARIAEMTRALKDGHFPVRWSQNFGFGYGMPLFQFYGPLPYYAASLVYLFSSQLIFAVKSMFLLSNILTAIGAFLLGKKLFKYELSALVVSAALTLAPYRALNLYVRGAVNETWGIMAVSWIFWAIIKVIKGEKFGWWWLSLSLTVLFLSHNLAALMFTPFIAGFAAVYLFFEKINHSWDYKQLLANFAKLVWPVLLASGLSFFYLIPAYFEKDFTQVSQIILGDYFNYNLHFVYIRQFFDSQWGFGGSEWGPDDPISFFLGWGQFFSLGLGVVFLIKLIIQIKQKNSWKKLIMPVFIGLSAFISLAMTTQKTVWIWDSFSLLEYMQFPWRFLGAAAVFLALFAGWVVRQITQSGLSKIYQLGLLSIVAAGMLINAVYFRPEKMLNDPNEYYFADPGLIRAETSKILPDYIPTGMDEPHQIEPVFNLVLNQDELPQDLIEIITNRTHRKKIKTDFNQPQMLELAIANYPNWRASINNEELPLTDSDITDSDITNSGGGTISVNVPQGSQILSIKLHPTRLRLISDLVSLLSLIVLMISLAYHFFGHKIQETINRLIRH